MKRSKDGLKVYGILSIDPLQGSQNEKREKGAGCLFKEKTAENFPNLKEETEIQIYKAQRVSNKMKTKIPTLRSFLVKLLKIKNKEKILKAAREEQLFIYKRIPRTSSVDFSEEILQAKRE